MEKRLAEKPHECEIETMVYAHGTHFVFPEGMLKIMLPVGSGLFVKFAFQAAKKYPKECRQTGLDIEKRMGRVLAEWKGAKGDALDGDAHGHVGGVCQIVSDAADGGTGL